MHGDIDHCSKNDIVNISMLKLRIVAANEMVFSGAGKHSTNFECAVLTVCMGLWASPCCNQATVSSKQHEQIAIGTKNVGHRVFWMTDGILWVILSNFQGTLHCTPLVLPHKGGH